MKSYIFITDEGSTFPPNSGSFSEEIENLQVLGIEKGITITEAFNNLIRNNKWIEKASFKEVTGYSLENDTPSYFQVPTLE